ncbi:MAG: glutathione S-transferase family protein [Polyangiaceae bacterium]
MLLYDSAFSPFARKIRLVLDTKGLEYEVVDGLARKNRDALASVNGRVEVPALVDDGLVVINSSDIVAYLERRYPDNPVYPADTKQWVRARAWERCSDTVVDPIIIDVSYWLWAERDDSMPAGLFEAARVDLVHVYEALERDLAVGPFVAGPLSIADLALFPHMTAVRTLNLGFDAERFPRLYAWYKTMRTLPACIRDLERTKALLADPAAQDIERHKIFWRGDRIEWLLARGYDAWFMREIEAKRVIWPGLAIPG